MAKSVPVGLQSDQKSANLKTEFDFGFNNATFNVSNAAAPLTNELLLPQTESLFQFQPFNNSDALISDLDFAALLDGLNNVLPPFDNSAEMLPIETNVNNTFPSMPIVDPKHVESTNCASPLEHTDSAFESHSSSPTSSVHGDITQNNEEGTSRVSRRRQRKATSEETTVTSSSSVSNGKRRKRSSVEQSDEGHMDDEMQLEENNGDNTKDPVVLKRMRNTEAARRSRMRKVIKMETLENEVKDLETSNNSLRIRLAVLESEKSLWNDKERDYNERIRKLESQVRECHNLLALGVGSSTMFNTTPTSTTQSYMPNTSTSMHMNQVQSSLPIFFNDSEVLFDKTTSQGPILTGGGIEC